MIFLKTQITVIKRSTWCKVTLNYYLSDEKNALNITEKISESINECETEYTDNEKSDIPKVNHGKLPAVSHGNFTTKKDKKLLVCKYEGCCASYIYKKSFKIHLLTHNHNKIENTDMKSNTLPAVCETCGETFKTEIYLYNHNRNFHKHFKCKECKKVGINFTPRDNTQLFIQ